jgi:hypothetical protein
MGLRHILPALGCAFVMACGLAELVGSPKISNVVLTYTGPDVLTVGDRVPFAVAVSVDGALLPNPRLSVSSSPDTIITLSPHGDTLFALARGFGTLTIRFVPSIFTDSFPTIVQQVRVNP